MTHHAVILRLCLASITVFLWISPAPASQRGLELTTQPSFLNEALGTYHALIIGIDKYREWNHLQTAVKDAVALRNVLVESYGFDEKNVRLRTDEEATRLRIISDLRELAADLGETDNLLVYFAGHGQLDDLTGDGYWIPVEGELKNPGTWISQATIKGILGSEKARAKNVVVIADSCYSGTLLRGGPSLLKIEGGAYLDKLAEAASKRSRQVITSGGLEPVADGGRDGHSLFAYYLIKALRENDREVVDLENLFHTRVWAPVTQIGGQRPNVGRLKTPMDEDGQFVLKNRGLEKRRAALAAEEARERDRTDARPRGEAGEWDRLEAERRLLEAERRQLEEERRLLKERKTLEAERLALEKEKQLMAVEAERKRLEKEKDRIGTPEPEAESAPRVTSLPPAGAPPPPAPADGGITVGVLPWRFDHRTHLTNKISPKFSFDIVAAELAETREFRLTHSAYPAEGTAAQGVRMVSLSSEEGESLWVKQGVFSKTRLDTKAAASIGRRLGVDLVFMLHVTSSGAGPEIAVSIIDTSTGRVFTETRACYSLAYLSNLAQITERQLHQYLVETSP
ncbi:MAG: caspase family protein [Deltaproteobacteria bacterium]|nr:caspase family protein [Deltaproteobacteria bacterium]